jgi:dihydrofolate reductase
MRKLVLFMHISVDGFTARSNGSIDWIRFDDETMELARIRTEASDTALYGRKTFELMDGYWPTAADNPKATKHDIEHATWYNQVDKLVVSETMASQQRSGTTIISDQVINRVNDLKQKTGREIIMFGSPGLAAFLMNNNLIDDFWLFVNPVILGEGTPLFRNAHNEIKLNLVKNIALKRGVTGLHYSKE